MKHLLFLLISCCCLTFSYAQENNLSLSKKNMFMLEEAPIQGKALKKLLQPHPNALKAYQKGRMQFLGGGMLMLSGGGFLGYEIGLLTTGNNPNWTNIGIGAGVVSLGVLISKGYKKRYKKAVDLYNQNETAEKPKVKMSKNGLGLILQF